MSTGLTFLPKQQQLINSDCDLTLFGGARGGAKTFGSAAAMALSVGEIYTESEFISLHYDARSYRSKQLEDGSVIYFRYVIDYPYYNGVIVRRSKPQLRANTLVETRKIYTLFGAVFDRADYCWVFPSGAQIYLRPLSDDATLNFFQGPNFQRMCFEELTQFSEDIFNQATASCRSAPPIGGGYQIPARVICTSNPGGPGHKWVKALFVDKCPPLPDGDPRYLQEYDLEYQPLKSGNVFENEHGEKFQFIPSLVFDNPYLVEHDLRYVRRLNSMNPTIRQLWLLGRWDINVGQYFSMWDDSVHIVDEFEFYNVTRADDLHEARRTFDWKGKGYRLYISNDYGFSEKSAWALTACAVDDALNVIQFAEIVQSGLTINQQIDYTIEFFLKEYDLDVTRDFEEVVGDPKSYWQRQDRGGDEFFCFADEYLKRDIYMVKGNNNRLQGAAVMADTLKVENGKSRLMFMNNCTQTIDCISTIPASVTNPDDVDTTTFDHTYDSLRYLLMRAIYPESDNYLLDKNKYDWRNQLGRENTLNSDDSSEVRSYLTV